MDYIYIHKKMVMRFVWVRVSNKGQGL